MRLQGLAETDFTFIPPSQFVHKETGEHFDFHVELHSEGARTVVFSEPGKDSLSSQYCSDFNRSVEQFEGWCKVLQRYIIRVEEANNLPDIFTTASRPDSPVQALIVAPSLENHPLSPEERQLVAQKLGELEAYIHSNRELTTDQLQILGDQIRYLAESSERMGRKDWLTVLLGVLFGFVISGIFDPARAEEMMRHAFGLFQFLSDTGLLP
jgi:hypothetical protein